MVFSLTLIAALGCGIIGGTFFAFSVFVMNALARLPAAHAITAMQSINRSVITALFLICFLGTAAACVALIVCSVLARNGAGSAYLLAGSFIYLMGVILVTFVFNVPKNDALAAVDPASAEGAELWTSYLSSWSLFNHVRTFAGIAASGVFTLALRDL